MPRAITHYEAPENSGKILYPEVVDPRIADVEAVARWLDYAFELPGGFRYGLGGLIGLIPGVGDIFEALLSLYIVGRAVQIGIPRVTLTRMVVNVGIESLAGSVPFIGAMFDTVFKANRRNYQLLRSHISTPMREVAKDWWFLAITAVIALAGVLLPLVIVIYLFKHL